MGCGERSSVPAPSGPSWARAVLCAWHRVILCPVGAAAIQTLLFLRVLTGLCGAGVMLCLLPVLLQALDVLSPNPEPCTGCLCQADKKENVEPWPRVCGYLKFASESTEVKSVCDSAVA